MPRERAFVEGRRETAYQAFDSLPAAQGPNQDRVTMVKALRRWLETNQLPAIVAGVVGGLILLSAGAGRLSDRGALSGNRSNVLRENSSWPCIRARLDIDRP